MRYPIRKKTLLYRDPTKDLECPDFLAGDVWEFPEPAIKEVDPRTRTARQALQCFRVGDDNRSLTPIARGSW